MAKRNWKDGVLGNTPLSAIRLNQLESDLNAALLQLARDPAALFAGAVTYNADGAPVSAVVKWPDGVDGTYSGTASSAFPGSITAYSITRAVSPTMTYTQPNVTRDGVTGQVVNRPPIVVTGGPAEEYIYPDPVTPVDLDAALAEEINDSGSAIRGAMNNAYATRNFNGAYSTAGAPGVSIVDTGIAPKATLRYEDTAGHESSVIEIAHKGSAPLGTGGGQAYGINIANHPGARNAFTIHQYSSFAPAVQIDNTDINSAIYIKNTDNQTQNPGNYGTGPFLQLKPQGETDALFLTDGLVWNNLTTKDMRIVGQNANLYTLNVESPASRDTRALYVTKQGLGVGNALDVLNKGTGAGINLAQTGSGTGLNITMTDTSGAAKYGIFVTAKNYGAYVKSETDGGVTLDVDKTGTGNGTAVKIRNLGTGDSLSLVNASTQVARFSAGGEYENLLNGQGIILRSPDGTRFRIAVSNAGAIAATAI